MFENFFEIFLFFFFAKFCGIRLTTNWFHIYISFSLSFSHWIVDNFLGNVTFRRFHPGIFIREIPPRFAVSVIFYQIYSTDVHPLWRSLLVIFIEIKYRESFHRIPEFHFENLSFTIFHGFRLENFPSLFSSPDYQYHHAFFRIFSENFLATLAYPCISIAHLVTFFIEITYRRPSVSKDSRRRISIPFFSFSTRRSVHTNWPIRCCYVAPRGGHV